MNRFFSIFHKVINLLVVSFFGYSLYFIGRTTLTNWAKLEPDLIPLSGTGSMYPTFPKSINPDREQWHNDIVTSVPMRPYPNGITLGKYQLFQDDLQRGDIVTLDSRRIFDYTSQLNSTPSGGLLKRVIALPGDTLELRSGEVYVNLVRLDEPYLAQIRSTFGGEFLPDCQKLTIPEGKLFVMGDNRKGSSDSRHKLGLVDIHEITHILPVEKQRIIVPEVSAPAQVVLNREYFLQLLNAKRQKPLSYHPHLNRAAEIFGQNSFANPKYRFETALEEADYNNIVYGEWHINGSYTAEELIETIFEFPDLTKFVSDTRYSDFGLAEVNGETNQCPGQVTILYFGGYVPPNYSKELITSWQQALTDLHQVYPSWQALTDPDSQKIQQLLATRIDRISKIVTRLTANQWLTPEEEAWTRQDPALAGEIDALARKINSR